MKNTTLLFSLLFSVFSLAQEEMTFERMVESEMKSAAALQAFTVNPNTQNYDVTHTELRFTVDPANYFITGKVTPTFKALSEMTTVTFDFTNELTVSTVTQGLTPLSFVQNASNELVITLPATLQTGNSATISITYSGAPPSGEDAFTQAYHSGTPIIFTLSEPFGARDWWPCKQDLNDKIDSIDVYISCPNNYIGVSNGLLQSSTIANNIVTRHFKHNFPIPAYLISLNVTNYVSYNIQAGLGTTQNPYFPINNYLYPETNTTTTQNLINATIPVMNVFESKFGLYPYRSEQYGHVQFPWNGGMEHTTMSSMGSFPRFLIAHELGHQWFGDKITCGSWNDIWLNEGFAEYSTGIVIENLDGISNFVNWKNSKINNITSVANGAVYLTDSEAQNVARIFSSRLSYNKGAMVVHMLRWVMGDANFFTAVQNYLNDPDLAFGYAVTTDLKAHLEEVHGNSLTEFFNDWVFEEGYPTYTITAQNWGTGQAKITVNQSQSHSSVAFFEMPIEIRLVSATGTTHDVVVQNTEDNQEFVVNVPFVVTNVLFDPNKHIISRNNTATLSVTDFESKTQVAIFPNPAKHSVKIELQNQNELEKIEIFNALGQFLATEYQQDFSISAYAQGVYSLKISTTEGVYYKKIIKN